MLPEVPDEQLAAELDSIALDALMGEGVDHPPVDAFEIARGMRLAVAWDDRQRGRARCVRLVSLNAKTLKANAKRQR